MHSTTKYIGGHSDVVGGALVVADGAQLPVGLDGPTGTTNLADAVRFHQNASGAVAGPFDAWLTLRGLKTLAVRMDRHESNARAVADFLVAHDAVTSVIYPGLADHPGHEVAARQMTGFGGMISFRTGSEASALAVCAATHVFTLAESLGGVESLIEHPHQMTHGSVAGTELEVPDDLVRLSVGIEDVADLIADLDAALAARARRMSAARAALRGPPTAPPCPRPCATPPRGRGACCSSVPRSRCSSGSSAELKVVVVPIAVALLVTVLLAPFVGWLDRRGLPRVAAVGLSLVGLVVLVAGLLTLAGRSIVKGFGELWDQAARGRRQADQVARRRPAAADDHRHLRLGGTHPGVRSAAAAPSSSPGRCTPPRRSPTWPRAR